MRIYVVGASILSTFGDGIKLLRKTLHGPPGWKIWLLWASWAISLVVVIAEFRESRAPKA